MGSRIDDQRIRSHDPVTAPDAVIVQEPTLLHLVPVLAGLDPLRYLLVKLGAPAEYVIDLDYCKGCGLCVAESPAGAIATVPEEI